MNVSNANLQVSVNVTQTMDTNMPMSQPPPLIRRRSVDPSKQVDEDIVCIDSDSEDTPSNDSSTLGRTSKDHYLHVVCTIGIC
ncbi:unnamed protein product [Acanthoscelides obtectus]|uniref:Uncharacterized protein n=1 Tax=Acanthoscelides obtectus TaxID=200917 RepID=A0A9P0NYU3_ACAOB|nr:unnamed protein product [Acanthoscelides obtectus]CAK1663414.1 hypothetical protein AOBTE_LOCUS23658 [Acanthoscelides obtectus]